MSPHPCQGTELPLPQATSRDAGMEFCTVTANVTGPPRDHWHSSVIPHGGKRKAGGVLMTPSSQTFGVSSYIWRMSLAEPCSAAHCGAQHHLTEVTATPEPARASLESSQADTDQTHLDSPHHLTKLQVILGQMFLQTIGNLDKM